MHSTLFGFLLYFSTLLVGFQGFQSHEVSTRYGDLHYFEAQGQGDLPPIVMLHGLGSQAADLSILFPHLLPHTRKIIALDLAAHGHSRVPVERLSLDDIEQSFYQGLDHILADEGPVILWGNSLGGWHAILYALHRPQALSHLILVSPAGAQVTAEQAQSLEEVFIQNSAHNPEALLPLLYNTEPAYRDFAVSLLRSRFGHPAVQAYMQRLNPERFLKPEELQALQTPTLLIWGDSDRIFPGQRPFFVQHLPAAQTQVLTPPHFTHSPYIEADMELELTQMMLHWLRQKL